MASEPETLSVPVTPFKTAAPLAERADINQEAIELKPMLVKPNGVQVEGKVMAIVRQAS